MSGCEWRFTGKQRDVETGLTYFNARYYDAAIGRFITLDPVKDGTNWYVYCENNPLKYVDLEGTRLRSVDTIYQPDLFGLPETGGPGGGSWGPAFSPAIFGILIEAIIAAVMGGDGNGGGGNGNGPPSDGSASGDDGGATPAPTPGSNIRNKGLAGKTHPVTGVPFDDNGFPDFSDHLYQSGPNDVTINPIGSRPSDYAAANEAAGYSSTPKGYTWHHHQDTGRMQLVESDIHGDTGHTGGFSLW